MANLDAPRGFVPVRYLSGAPYNGAVSRYRKEASVILGVGDAVVLSGTSSTAGTNNAPTDGVPLVTRAAAASGTITGVVMWCEIDSSNDRYTHAKHMAAADTGYVYVADNPMLVFRIQEDSVGNELIRTDVGEGVDIVVVNADTNTGYSAMEIDSSTSAAQIGNADQLRLLELDQREDNAIGAQADWLVMINEHTYAGVGTMI